ncbi:MAG: hypothetical protein Q9173_005159 [Seirophora scorigena]
MDDGQPQPKRCDFFLWDDAAKSREATAVLSNSRTEPVPPPQTPTKPQHLSTSYGLQTPLTDPTGKHRSPEQSIPYTPSKPPTAPRNTNDTQETNTTLATSDEEFYDWPSSDNEDVLRVADQTSSMDGIPPPETTSKIARTSILTSPGKRTFSQMGHGAANARPTPPDTDGDVFVTPSTGLKRNGFLVPGQALSSPSDTPTPRRFKDVLQTGQDSKLASEILKILQEAKVSITSDVKAELQTVCDRHALSTRGILKGRDISRTMVNTKNAEISELQETIAALQAERETNRAIIRHLRQDMELAKNSGS